jgi:hypothetical protein
MAEFVDVVRSSAVEVEVLTLNDSSISASMLDNI